MLNEAEQVVETLAPRYVMVGGQPCKVNESEWVASVAEKGQRVKVTPRDGEPYVMVVMHSWFYDGVILEGHEVDPDDLIRRTAHPAFGDKIVFV